MLKLFHQNHIAGHRATGEATRDEDIACAVLQHNKRKVLAQLDHLAQQRFVRTAGTHRKKYALTLADDSVVHQLVYRFHHFSVCTAVTAKF